VTGISFAKNDLALRTAANHVFGLGINRQCCVDNPLKNEMGFISSHHWPSWLFCLEYCGLHGLSDKAGSKSSVGGCIQVLFVLDLKLNLQIVAFSKNVFHLHTYTIIYIYHISQNFSETWAWVLC
jgi:hypothetical protein